jgi:hypothetical protein
VRHEQKNLKKRETPFSPAANPAATRPRAIPPAEEKISAREPDDLSVNCQTIEAPQRRSPNAAEQGSRYNRQANRPQCRRPEVLGCIP